MKRKQFPEVNKGLLIKLFIKYTAVIPSSATAEPFFSTAGDVLATLSNDNFNNCYCSRVTALSCVVLISYIPSYTPRIP